VVLRHLQLRQIFVTVHDDRIDRGQAPHRFAQRSRGQEQAVAEAPRAVYDGNFEIARQRIVLQAIVAQKQIALRMRTQQRGGCFEALPAGEDRNVGAAREQHGFVAGDGRIAVRADFLDLFSTTVAARDDARVIAVVLEKFREPGHQRSLSGTADRDVAYDHHRHAHAQAASPSRPIQRSARGSDCGKYQTQWVENYVRGTHAVPQVFEHPHTQPSGSNNAFTSSAVSGRPAGPPSPRMPAASAALDACNAAIFSSTLPDTISL